MKKILTFFLSLTVAAGLFAQTADDAVGIAQEYYEGTARTMAMGGAFTALGGDLGAIALNPASSGVLGASMVSFTPSLTSTHSLVQYLGNNEKTNNTGLTLSNFGTVINFDTGNYTGLVSYSFGFVYNKKNNYRSKMYAMGATDDSSMLSAIANSLEGIDWTDIDLEKSPNAYTSSGASWPGILAWNTYVLAPLSYLGGKYSDVNDSYMASTENYDAATDQLRIGGLLDQRFNRRTRGSNDEFSFNFGANLSDRFYLGANLNLLTVSQTTEEYYEEKARDYSRFDDGFVSMDNSFWMRTSGAGVNIKLGVIAAPVAGLRLGATITTPSWYSLTDQWDYTMNTSFNNGHKYTEYSPTGSWNYRLTTPMRWSVGAAYTFWDRGLVSVDYEQVNYANTKLRMQRGSFGNYGDYASENAIIRADYRNAGILRAGAEIRVADFLSLRGGFQHYWPIARGEAARNAYSAGLGFNLGPGMSIDLAWMRLGKVTNEFSLYEDYGYIAAPRGLNTQSVDKVVCTFALKF